jgi:TRAP-type C4-dicarboxylate transport system permease small subunit
VVNVVARNALGRSISSADEISQALLVAITFIGIASGARRGRHVRMAALWEQLPARLRKPCWCLVTGGTALLLAALAVLAARYVAQVAGAGRVTPALRLPLAAVYAVAPLGLLAGAVEYARILVWNLRSPGIHIDREGAPFA